jgi:hypothetical protein
MITLLLIGGLLLLGVSLMVLNISIEHAVDGHEDRLGFHQESTHWTREAASSASEVNRWDQIEGACCPLDMSSSFRPMGDTPVKSRGQ